jgi:cell division protein ZapA
VYPLTVDFARKKAFRSASKKIDKMIKQFEENYAVRDKQDVLAMCALQFASKQNKNKLIMQLMEKKPSKELKNQFNFRPISRQINVLYKN